MNNKELLVKIDESLKEAWNNVIGDHTKDFLLMEDTLKSSLYFHLRNKIGDEFLSENHLRIFTEYKLEDINGQSKIIDLAIVKVKKSMERDLVYHVRDRVDEVLSIIELKFKNGGKHGIRQDVKKIKEYSKMEELKKCKFYLGVAYEAEDFPDDYSWLNKNLDNSWAKNKLTELTAYSNEKGVMTPYIISHT